jgi:hypothetical protein
MHGASAVVDRMVAAHADAHHGTMAIALRAIIDGALGDDGATIANLIASMAMTWGRDEPSLRILALRALESRLDEVVMAKGRRWALVMAQDIVRQVPSGAALAGSMAAHERASDMLGADHLFGYDMGEHGFEIVSTERAYEARLAAADVCAKLCRTLPSEDLRGLRDNANAILGMVAEG